MDYIADRADDARAGKPFFLYLPLTSPHTPIVPSPEWQGRSGLNPYGDFVMETDDCIGQVIEALEKQRLAGNTLVIVTSDNGCSPAADLKRFMTRDITQATFSAAIRPISGTADIACPWLSAGPARFCRARRAINSCV